MTQTDIDRIKAYLDGRSRNVFHCIHQFNEDGPADLTAAIVEIERLRKALSFYANEHNYNDDPSDIPGSPVPGTAPIWVDHGATAQEILK